MQTFSILVISLALVACGKQTVAPQSTPASAKASAHVFSAQQQQLQQSRQVGDELQKAADAQRDVIEQSLQGGAASASASK